VFSLELDRTGTGEQDYTLAPCKPVSPLPPLSSPTVTLKVVLLMTLLFVRLRNLLRQTKFRSAFRIVFRQTIRCCESVRSMLVPCVTFVLLVFHSRTVKRQKYVYLLNRKAAGIIWTYYVSKNFYFRLCSLVNLIIFWNCAIFTCNSLRFQPVVC
jgi:hypothetical protein